MYGLLEFEHKSYSLLRSTGAAVDYCCSDYTAEYDE